jgi:hypothetical protein
MTSNRLPIDDSSRRNRRDGNIESSVAWQFGEHLAPTSISKNRVPSGWLRMSIAGPGFPAKVP